MAEQVNIIDSVNSFDMSSDDEDDSFLNAIRENKHARLSRNDDNNNNKRSQESSNNDDDLNKNSSDIKDIENSLNYDDDFIEESIDNSQIDSTKNPNTVINEENANEKRQNEVEKASNNYESKPFSFPLNQQLPTTTSPSLSSSPPLPSQQQTTTPYHFNSHNTTSKSAITHNNNENGGGVGSRIASLNNRIAQNAATPVRSRLENLSSRLAESARVQAVEKRNKASAMAQTLKEVVEMNNYLNEKVSWLTKQLENTDANKRIRGLEDSVKSLNEQLDEERRLRKSNEDKYRTQFERLTSEISRAKRDMERNVEDHLSNFRSRMQEAERGSANAESQVIELNGIVARLGETVIKLENNETSVKRDIAEVKHMTLTEKHVREEMENTLMKMLDDMFGKLRWKIEEEKKTRESTEEAILKILEDTLNRVDILE